MDKFSEVSTPPSSVIATEGLWLPVVSTVGCGGLFFHSDDNFRSGSLCVYFLKRLLYIYLLSNICVLALTSNGKLKSQPKTKASLSCRLDLVYLHGNFLNYSSTIMMNFKFQISYF